MLITKQRVADMLAAYLRHDIKLEQLVDWAENAMMDGEFSEQDMEAVSTVIARLGIADVRAFGRTWEDCEQLLKQLGYTAQVQIQAV